MRLRGRFRLSYANVIATVALFVALSGTSYAAIRITGKNIKNNTVTSKDIKNRTIRSKDLAKGLLGSAKATPLNSAAFQASRDVGPSGVAPGSDYTAVASLTDVQPGAYVILAKTDMQSDQQDSSRCRLQAESSFDESNRGLRANGTGEAHNLQLAHTFTSPGTISLLCRTSGGNWTASDTKLLAIKIGSAQSTGVIG
jgi:hypothetical protein